MKKIYLIALSVFVSIVVAVNVTTFFTSFDKKQLINLYNMSERIQAIACLAKHVIFESGLILKEAPEDDLNKLIDGAAIQNGIEPHLVHALLKDIGQKAYAIDTSGAMGYMRISMKILANYPDKDPFSAKDNIDMGVAHFASLIASYGSSKAAAEQYAAFDD